MCCSILKTTSSERRWQNNRYPQCRQMRWHCAVTALAAMLLRCRCSSCGAQNTLVLDSLFSAEEAWGLHAEAHHREYTLGESDHANAAPAGSVHELNLTEPFTELLRGRIERSALGLLGVGEDPPRLYRAYINRFESSDHPSTHRDAGIGEPHVTALVYANEQWQRDWGGETMFYTEEHEVVQAVRPRPGRVVLFSGGIMHSARPPLPRVPVARYTIALKWATHSPVL